MQRIPTKKLRNIGIIAHVDAGKTTVTERILFFTGKIHAAGDVHDGNTKMDFKKTEIAHGITVSAAATTVPWRDHAIQIIDTPGHIDFNLDVRCALRVLDGAVVVFDAVAGVEPQTETNWRLADEFQVSRIAFVNKLDRMGADFDRVIGMMRDRLGVNPLPLQIPAGRESGFQGMIDLLQGVLLTWPDADGRTVVSQPIPDALREEAEQRRAELIARLADEDDAVAEAYLAGQPVSVEMLQRAIRHGVVAGRLVPVLGGSALRFKGVQPLLDAVVDYLPAPEDRPLPAVVTDDQALVVLVFKTQNDQNFGQLSFCRVYAGELHPGMTTWNPREQQRERVSRVYRMHADSKEQAVDAALPGEIVALAGLKHTRTGDTLCEVGHELLLAPIAVPEAVASVVLEAADRDHREKLALGLARLLREDPALRLATHPETGQLVLSGMGELHLQIAREELEDGLGFPIVTGKPLVAYRETVTRPAEVEYLHRKQGGGPGQYAKVTLQVEPLERGEGLVFVNTIRAGAIPAEYIPAVERGVRARAESGVLRGHPLVDVRVTLVDGQTHVNDSSSLAFETAGAMGFRDACLQAAPVLLEPVMKVEVVTPEDYLGAVMGDLSRRRGLVTGQRERGNARVVDAQVPLSAMFGYIGDLRSFTEGRASFGMEFDHYGVVSATELARLTA